MASSVQRSPRLDQIHGEIRDSFRAISYTNTPANKRVELFDERGINESTTDDNVQMTPSIISQELTNVGKKTMDENDPAIDSSKMVVEQTVEMGRQSAFTLEGQVVSL